ncbi:MAG TPA: DUF3343 domain-containing protein [bacterium]|nr:DUF3343 domain-containing protein [bacterium]
MSDVDFSVITFHSTSHAIQAERICKKRGIRIKLVPVPRDVSSDCGICIRFGRKDKEIILEALNEQNVEIANLVDIN